MTTPADGARPGELQLQAIVDVADGWDGAARCRGADAALFFGPNRFEPKADRLAREARAKALCAECPVLRTCREHALANDELFGVWGGLSEADRRALLEAPSRSLRVG
jgi:WhiB family transcriptional regulator, redox-sensing transcriptional regulator